MGHRIASVLGLMSNDDEVDHETGSSGAYSHDNGVLDFALMQDVARSIIRPIRIFTQRNHHLGIE